MAAFWAALLVFGIYRARKREVGGTWLVQIILLGLFLRLAMAFVHLMVGFWFYGGQVDLTGYHHVGIGFGQSLLQGDFQELGPGYLFGLFYLLAGPSIVGMSLLSGLIGFWGSYLFLRGFEVGISSEKDRHRRFLVLGLFLLPSLTYWATLLGKDSWIFFLLGSASYAFANLLKGFRLRYAFGLIASIAVVAMIRIPVATALIFAAGVAFLLRGGGRGPAAILRPIGLLVSVVVIAVLVRRTFLAYAGMYVETVDSSLIANAVEVALIKHTGLSTDPTGSGSSLSVGLTEPSVAGILSYLPMGMFTFLFRPLIFEAHHALALAAALESTFLLILVLRRRRNLFAAVRSVFSKPFVCYIVVLCSLLTVMLSFETNFGVIVRHRTMVLPFLLILLSMPSAQKPQPSRHWRTSR